MKYLFFKFLNFYYLSFGFFNLMFHYYSHCLILYFYLAAISDDRIEFGVLPEKFVSKKLTNKITQQLSDCLVLASMALPDWCERLTKWCPMLFSYDLRSLYFNYTAYGTSR